MKTSCAKSPSGASLPSSANRQTFFAANRQLSFADALDTMHPGAMNDAAVVRGILIDSIRKCGKSREQIADEMSLATGTEITVRRLNGYTAESAEDFKFPAELERAFCAATGDYRLLKCHAERSGFQVITTDEAKLLELGRQYLLRKRSEETIAYIERSLQGVDL